MKEQYLKENRKNKSTRNIPYQELKDDELRSFLLRGWRVRSKKHGIYVEV